MRDRDLRPIEAILRARADLAGKVLARLGATARPRHVDMVRVRTDAASVDPAIARGLALAVRGIEVRIELIGG